MSTNQIQIFIGYRYENSWIFGLNRLYLRISMDVGYLFGYQIRLYIFILFLYKIYILNFYSYIIFYYFWYRADNNWISYGCHRIISFQIRNSLKCYRYGADSGFWIFISRPVSLLISCQTSVPNTNDKSPSVPTITLPIVILI